MLTSLYQFNKKLTLFPNNIYMFKVRIVTLRNGVKSVEDKWKRPITYWKETSKTIVSSIWYAFGESDTVRYQITLKIGRFSAGILPMGWVRLCDLNSLRGSRWTLCRNSVFVFLLPFLTSKQIFAVVLAVFQCWYHRAIIIQWNKGLHFLHINIYSWLPKTDELKCIANKTKTTIIGITESKFGHTVSDLEVNLQGYDILRCDWNRSSGGVACYKEGFMF